VKTIEASSLIRGLRPGAAIFALYFTSTQLKLKAFKYSLTTQVLFVNLAIKHKVLE
jgi:hypothetical protein